MSSHKEKLLSLIQDFGIKEFNKQEFSKLSYPDKSFTDFYYEIKEKSITIFNPDQFVDFYFDDAGKFSSLNPISD
ncbi:MAG: hypothetical protein WC373_04905 [Smithella sp.]|jgi:hypothetical protein